MLTVYEMGTALQFCWLQNINVNLTVRLIPMNIIAKNHTSHSKVWITDVF